MNKKKLSIMIWIDHLILLLKIWKQWPEEDEENVNVDEDDGEW